MPVGCSRRCVSRELEEDDVEAGEGDAARTDVWSYPEAIAGPLEDLLAAHGPQLQAAVAERCRRWPRWRQAVSASATPSVHGCHSSRSPCRSNSDTAQAAARGPGATPRGVAHGATGASAPAATRRAHPALVTVFAPCRNERSCSSPRWCATTARFWHRRSDGLVRTLPRLDRCSATRVGNNVSCSSGHEVIGTLCWWGICWGTRGCRPRSRTRTCRSMS